jgi:tRNA(Ile)-lysidine synthase
MQTVSVVPGKYVVAVSGGVDSVVLLELLSKNSDVGLVVAHFDHGIRKDSGNDRLFVGQLAGQYNLPFEFAEGKLGPSVSEQSARNARYAFLESVRAKHQAVAVITAHHRDDVIETLIINLLRGTGRLGLGSLVSGQKIVRPLIDMSKDVIIDFARQNNLKWREDPTNTDTKYMRNWVRHKILPKLNVQQKELLAQINKQILTTNQEIDSIINQVFIGNDKTTLNRFLFTIQDHKISTEACAVWLRANGYRDFDKSMINRLTIGMKTLPTGKTVQAGKGFQVNITNENFVLKGHFIGNL